MFRKQYKPKNPYKLQATSRRAGGHTPVKYLKEKQREKEIKQIIKEELNDK